MDTLSRYVFFAFCCFVCCPAETNTVLPQKGSQQQILADEARGVKKRLVGRHVCTKNKVVMTTVSDIQSYCKPSYQTYLRKCSPMSAQYCTGYRVTYELAYRPAKRLVAQTKTSFACCPGWAQSRPSAGDCKRALCTKECQNGGTCVKPGQCACLPGWTGAMCETDVDECQKHICDQVCLNTRGSYRCSCHQDFQLQLDGKTCKRVVEKGYTQSTKDFARDLEEVNRKIQRLEQHMSGVLNLNSKVETLTDILTHHLNTYQSKSETVPAGEQPVDATTQKRMSSESTEERINSLSEQIAILEERLAECTCTSKDVIPYPPPVR